MDALGRYRLHGFGGNPLFCIAVEEHPELIFFAEEYLRGEKGESERELDRQAGSTDVVVYLGTDFRFSGSGHYGALYISYGLVGIGAGGRDDFFSWR